MCLYFIHEIPLHRYDARIIFVSVYYSNINNHYCTYVYGKLSSIGCCYRYHFVLYWMSAGGLGLFVGISLRESPLVSLSLHTFLYFYLPPAA